MFLLDQRPYGQERAEKKKLESQRARLDLQVIW